MLAEKDYCDYDTSQDLWIMGVKPNTCYYGSLVLLYEAQKWLREEKKIEVNASFDKEDDGWIAFIQRLDYPDLCGTDVFSTVYNTYESALLKGIKEAVKLLKEEK